MAQFIRNYSFVDSPGFHTTYS